MDLATNPTKVQAGAATVQRAVEVVVFVVEVQKRATVGDDSVASVD